MRRVLLEVNGARHELDLEPRELLVYVLRDRLGLTGTNVGCDTSSCGACTVLVSGEAVKSCTILGVQADGLEVTTIEGLAEDGELHPIQQAYVDHTAFQCSYCTPGFLLTTKALLEDNPDPSREDAKHYLAGNLCRCGSYVKILDAVMDAKERVRQG